MELHLSHSVYPKVSLKDYVWRASEKNRDNSAEVMRNETGTTDGRDYMHQSCAYVCCYSTEI